MFSDNSVGARYLPVEIKRKDGGKCASKTRTVLHYRFRFSESHKWLYVLTGLYSLGAVCFAD